MKTISALLGTILLSGSVFAQSPSQQSVMSTSEAESKKASTMLSLDSLPLLLGGFGLGVDRAVMSQMSVGLFYDQRQPNTVTEARSSDYFVSDPKADLRTAGLRARVYFLNDFDRSGLYGGLALVRSEMNIKVKPIATLGASEQVSDQITKMGGQISAGYQFVFSRGLTPFSHFVIETGLIYGMGNTYGYEYTVSSHGSHLHAILENGFSAEGTASWMF